MKTYTLFVSGLCAGGAVDAASNGDVWWALGLLILCVANFCVGTTK